MKRFVKYGLAAMCSVAVMSTAVAQNAPPTPEQQAQQAVETRQALFKLMNFSFAPLAAMLRNRIEFDAALAQKAAERVEFLAPMISDVFQQDTRQFKNIKTQARDGIWGSKAEFDAKTQDMIKAAQALTAAAKSGDRAATLKAAGAAGKACGSCHDSFRNE